MVVVEEEIDDVADEMLLMMLMMAIKMMVNEKIYTPSRIISHLDTPQTTVLVSLLKQIM